MLREMNNVIAIGVDMVEIDRIERACLRFGRHFLRRIFRQEEVEYCVKRRRPFASLAARFAAKEATAKAMGVGFGAILQFRDIGLLNDGRGRPEIHLSDRARQVMERIGGGPILVSVSHHRTAAIASIAILASPRS